MSSDLPNHDHDPDPAALDELRRAFADPDDTEDDDERDGDDGGAGDGGGDSDAGGDRAEAPATGPAAPSDLVVENGLVENGLGAVQELGAAEDPEPTAAAAASHIIRIDDFAGATAVTDPEVTPESLARDASDGRPAAGPDATATPPGAPNAETPIAAPNPAMAPTVIAISDDELPDAVYVEGSLDADGSGSIVFIEDDDSGDVLAPESERDLRRGIEPRMRERRVAVKRAQSRRRLKRLAIVAGVVVLVVAVLAVLGSPLFAVREGDVEVSGARYTDEGRLAEIIDDAVGTPVLRLDTDAIEAQVEEIPWVDDAVVGADFPHGLTIDIRERAAMTTYQGPDGRFRVLDREGRVLDVLDMYPFAYVLIGGPDAVDLDPGDFSPQGYAAASELVKNLTGSMRGRVTQIEVTADGSRLVVHLDDGSSVYFGEARDLLAKLVRLEAVLANGEQCESGLIDVSTADVTRCSVT